MRPVQIVEKPIIHPHVCVSCGEQNNRQYFVDTGIEISQQYFNAVFEGVVYLCDICMESLITDYYKRLSTLRVDPVGATYTYLEDDQLELPFGETNDEPGGGNADSESLGESEFFGETEPESLDDDESDAADSGEPSASNSLLVTAKPTPTFAFGGGSNVSSAGR